MNTKLNVNIICSDVSWVYKRFIEYIKKYSKHNILINEKGNHIDCHYVFPYYDVNTKINYSKPIAAWFSHQELKNPLFSMFIDTAKKVDLAVSHSEKYADILKENGLSNVIQIMPGVDINFFTRRPPMRKKNKKLVVGFVGRTYVSTPRKNPNLLRRLSTTPWIDFRSTGGNIKFDKLPEFYHGLDIVVSPATVEGGPLCVQESLACGVPIILYEGVGVANEFNDGVIKVSYNNEEAFIGRLYDFLKNQEYLNYIKPAAMDKMRAQVMNFTWENFARQHDKVFEQIVLKSKNDNK